MIEPFTMTGVPAVDARIADGISSPTPADGEKALTAGVPGDAFWRNFKGSLDIAGAMNQKEPGQTSPSGGASHIVMLRAVQTNSRAQMNPEFAAGASSLSLPQNPQSAKPQPVSVHPVSSNSESNASQLPEPPLQVETAQLQGGQISKLNDAQKESTARPPHDDRAPATPGAFVDRLDALALVTSREAQEASGQIVLSTISRNSKTQEPHNVSDRKTAIRSVQNPSAPEASSWVSPSVTAPDGEAIYRSPALTNPMPISTLAVNQKNTLPPTTSLLEQAPVVPASSNRFVDSDQAFDAGSLAAKFLSSNATPAANDPPKSSSAQATRPETAALMTGPSDPIRSQVTNDNQIVEPGNLLTEIGSVNSTHFAGPSARQAIDAVRQLATVPIDPLPLESAAAKSAISLHGRNQLTALGLQVVSGSGGNIGIAKVGSNSRSNRPNQPRENSAARDLPSGESTAIEDPDNKSPLGVHTDLSPWLKGSQASPSQLDTSLTRIRSQEDSGQSKLHEGANPELTRLITEKESVPSPTLVSLTTNLVSSGTQEAQPTQSNVLRSASPSAVAAGLVPATATTHPQTMAVVQPPGIITPSGPQHAGLISSVPAQHDVIPTAQEIASTARPAKQLEVGMDNGMNGWLKVRAEFDDAGRVSASLIAASENAVETLHKDLPALFAYLQDRSVPVSSLVVHRADPGAVVSEPQSNGLADGLGRSGEREGQQSGSERLPKGEVNPVSVPETSLGRFLQSRGSEGYSPRNSGLINLVA